VDATEVAPGEKQGVSQRERLILKRGLPVVTTRTGDSSTPK
jgi:hypothetical protein